MHKVGGNLQSGVPFFSSEERIFASQGVIVLLNLSHKQGKVVKTACVLQKCQHRTIQMYLRYCLGKFSRLAQEKGPAAFFCVVVVVVVV